jgi:integrase
MMFEISAVAVVWAASPLCPDMIFGKDSRLHFNPHSFRKTLALLGGDLCETAEHYKAWSQNLGHDHVLTTFTSYGDVSSYRQAEIMRLFASPALEAAASH